MFSDLSSPKYNKKYACYKVSDVAEYFEDDDSLSIISGDSSLDGISLHSNETGSSRHSGRSVTSIVSNSDSASCYSNESGSVRRSGRNTPTRDLNDSASCHSDKTESLQGGENTPTKRNTPTRAARSRNSPARNTPTKNTPKANLFNVKVTSAKKDVLMENKEILRVKNIDHDNVRKSAADKGEESATKTPDRKRGTFNSDHEEVISVKKCRTEPRRKSLQPQIAARKSPRTETKVRRAQSVRIKRVGNEYQSFRDQTPDSSGPRTRTRLSEKFENCKKADEIKRSGREAFTVITNKQSPSRSKQSPVRRKQSLARGKQSPARNKQSPARSKQSPARSKQSPAMSANGKSPKLRSTRRK